MNSPISRRRFISHASQWALAAGIGVPQSGANGTPIIDAHVHFYDTRLPGIAWPPKNIPSLYSPHLPELFQALTSGLNVQGVVVIEAEARAADNDWVLELARTHPLILGYIARMNPGDADFSGQLKRYRRSPVFRGMRLSGDTLERGMKEFARHPLTLDLVNAGIVRHARELADLYPHLNIVLDHLPFAEWDNDLGAMRKSLAEVAKLPNVFAKVSNVPRRDAKGELVTDPAFYRPRQDLIWEAFGEDRVIYGSNWPVSDLTAPYLNVLQIVADYVNGRGKAAATKFFWRNAKRAYRV